MRWSEEVHENRTVEAIREAKKFYLGREVAPKGATDTHWLVLAAGIVAALAHCENRGKLRIIRLPFVGPWASKQLKVLRRKLAAPLARPASKRRPESAVHAAAAARREANARASSSGLQSQSQGQSQRQGGQSNQGNKKKNKGKKKR